MSFNSAKFAAGPYAVSYKSVALGLLVGENSPPQTSVTPFGQLIAGTHLYGRTPIDGIWLGANGLAQVELMEYAAPSLTSLLLPWGGSPTVGRMPAIGTSMYDSSGALIFTAQAGSLAATNGPAVRTCAKAVWQVDRELIERLGPNLRQIPLFFQLFLDDATTPDFYTDS